MKRFIKHILVFLMKTAFRFRYRVEVRGLDNLNEKTLPKPGGILFLPNHPTIFIDPVLAAMAPWPKYEVRPMAVEYFYYAPFIHGIMKFVGALPVPNFDATSNSVKKRRNEDVFQELMCALREGDHFMIYPAGRTKSTGKEKIGGSSGVHRIVHEVPECNVVLVRIKGLWGSSFSRYYTGYAPDMFKTLFARIKDALLSALFFLPRRKVIIELVPAPKDFPWRAGKLELNKWLENWYNLPDALSEQKEEHPGDSLIKVSYSRWYDKKFKKQEFVDEQEKKVDLDKVPHDVKEKIFKKISDLSEMPADNVSADMHISSDLGMDSLDVAELVIYLQDQFEIKGAPATELDTVKKVLGLATGQIDVVEQKMEEVAVDQKKWCQGAAHKEVKIPEGKTLHEMFLNSCSMHRGRAAIGDMRSGILTFNKLKVGAILLAEHIRTLPGDYIGILLPASVGATLCNFACLLAGKVPLFINWTIGPRHLEHVIELSKVESVLTSWAFIDRLGSCDLNGLESQLIFLEDVKRNFGLRDKLKALFTSKRSTKHILQHFGSDKISEEKDAVLLFTSGTEAAPKGVPLSHFNIRSMIVSGAEMLKFYQDDVFFGFLPPFHSFGYSICTILPVLSGFRVAFHPDPTDGSGLARGLGTWGVTLVAGAPTFLRGMLRSATKEQAKKLRLCISGAEAAPLELFQLGRKLGIERAVAEGYGITECSPVLTVNIPGEHISGVGAPLPCVDLLIVHPETLDPIDQSEQGLILAKGPNVFSGYLNPGLKSPFVTVNGLEWYNTGDLGHIDEKGHLHISGRLKRFVKVGGEMISLAAIEKALLEGAEAKGWLEGREEGAQLAVLAKEEEGKKSRFYMFSTFSAEVDEVNAILRDQGFSILVRISGVFQLDEIPLMGSGKIFYRQLENEYLNRPGE